MRQNIYKVLLGSFVLVMYCWFWGMCLRVICFPNETPLEKTIFCLAGSCQLEILSELSTGDHVYVPLSLLGRSRA